MRTWGWCIERDQHLEARGQRPFDAGRRAPVHNGVGRLRRDELLAERRVRKIICSFPRTNGSVVFDELYKAGQIELEVVPQGTLAERLRAASA